MFPYEFMIVIYGKSFDNSYERTWNEELCWVELETMDKWFEFFRLYNNLWLALTCDYIVE